MKAQAILIKEDGEIPVRDAVVRADGQSEFLRISEIGRESIEALDIRVDSTGALLLWIHHNGWLVRVEKSHSSVTGGLVFFRCRPKGSKSGRLGVAIFR